MVTSTTAGDVSQSLAVPAQQGPSPERLRLQLPGWSTSGLASWGHPGRCQGWRRSDSRGGVCSPAMPSILQPLGQGGPPARPESPEGRDGTAAGPLQPPEPPRRGGSWSGGDAP